MREALPKNFRDITVAGKGRFSREVERMINDEIIAREDELRDMYQDYIDDTGDKATSFVDFARQIIIAEEGLEENKTMRKKSIEEEVDAKKVKEETDTKQVIKDLADAYGDSNEAQGKMVIKEEVQIGDVILEAGDVIRLLKEEETQDIIEEFIDTNWSKDEESAGKAINLLKGLVFSDDKIAQKFIKDLDKLSNSMNVEDYVSE